MTRAKETQDTAGIGAKVVMNIRLGRERTSENLFYFVAVAAPLPLGSHNSATVAIWCILLAPSLLLAPKTTVPRHVLLIMGGVLLILAAYAFVIAEQSTPDVMNLNLVSLHDWSDWMSRQADVGLIPDQPYLRLGPTLACSLALCCGLSLGSDGARARKLLNILAGSGAAYAAFGIVSTLLDPTTLLWRERDDYVGVVLGTFINRNTAATFFGSCAAVSLLLLSEKLRDLIRSSPRELSYATAMSLLKGARRRELALRLLGALTSLSALFMTNSRAGVLFSLCGIFSSVVFLLGKDLRRSRRRSRIVIGAFAAVVVLLILLGGAVNHRFDTQGFSDEGRLDIYASTLRMIADHPWLGVGLGSFREVFPAYRSVPPSIWGVWDMAHSTPLDLSAEVGLPLAGCVCLACVAALVLLVRGAVVRRRDKVIPLAAAAVAFIGFAHSCIDFSLQIPGYSIVFMSIVGTGLAQSFRSERRDGNATPRINLAQNPTGAALS